MDTQKEREAFEDWYIRNMDANGDFEKISEPDSPYMDEHVNNSWLTWQAAKAQAVPEGFVLISAEQLNQWGHMANYAEQYGCPECFEARGYAHSLACEINAYFNVSEAQEPVIS